MLIVFSTRTAHGSVLLCINTVSLATLIGWICNIISKIIRDSEEAHHDPFELPAYFRIIPSSVARSLLDLSGYVIKT